MEAIYSVEEVADILKLQPFTVRKLFREGELLGFKIGKAWRITESKLESHIEQLQNGVQLFDQAASSPHPSPGTLNSSGVSADKTQPRESTSKEKHSSNGSESRDELPKMSEIDVTNRAPENPQGPASSDDLETVSNRSFLSIGVGRLIVFSELPGEEVYLDGKRKGLTTLSLLDVREGQHRLQVGEVSEMIWVLPEVEMHVRSAGGRLTISTRNSVPTATRMGEEIDSNLAVRIENHSELTGPIVVLLAGENTVTTARIFAEYANDPFMTNLEQARAFGLKRKVVEGKIQLSGTLVRGKSAVLFDGPIVYTEGNSLEITVPKQPGIDKEARRSCVLTPDLSVQLSVVTGGMLRNKHTVRIRLDK